MLARSTVSTAGRQEGWLEGRHRHRPYPHCDHLARAGETTAYRDLGSDYFTRRIDNPEAHIRRLIHELEALGHKVTIEPKAA
ncbi:hypothetical protein [Pseudonocardia aurantiaca]|uniref:Uncharacterized protein n=1 Tax=Pseudonocardia aurantiaca TaxID=75290 RepID=A0ABW4FY53_9PSEU